MKKNVLALSITAAAISLGFAGGAQAITAVGIGSGTAVAVAPNGIGHNLVVPYYTAQGANKTQINIVNTDTTNGKAVKVRFRSAANSDDVFDFQIFLSPGDVWSGEVSQDTATGKAKLASGDASCTKPSIKTATAANLLFKTDRLDNTSASATDATRAAQTREGYVEILTMADIRPTNFTSDANGLEAAGVAGANPLFTAIKHVAGVAPCSGTAFTALDTNLAGIVTAYAAGLARPTGSLLANWTILNTATSAAYGGQATALKITGPAVAVAAVGGTALVDTGNLTYWPQSPLSSAASSQDQTADPLLRLVAAGGNPTVAPTMVDLPDLSTPFLGQNPAQMTATSGPIAAANQLSAALAKTSVTNEFLTTTAFNASTDWTFSMPTRRYGVVFNYVAGTALFNGTAGTVVTTTGADSLYFQAVNSVVNAARRMVCVNNITPASTDREETTGSTIIFSPAVAPTLCGEVSVLSINNAASATSNSLLAVNTLNDVDATYREGWLSVATPGIAAGLPIIGNAFVRAYTGTINIGAAYAHR